MSHSEPEFEALLQRAYPGYEDQIQGCSAGEIAAIERHSPVPLPAFYRWFLERFGRDLGPLAVPHTDMRAAAVLEHYRREYGGAKFSLAGGLPIGYSMDSLWPDLRYDLRYPARNDARVTMSTLGKETLREMLAWRAFSSGIIPTFPQTGHGVIYSSSYAVLIDLTDVMRRLGFAQPLPTGIRTRFFMSTDAVLMFDGEFESNDAVAFHFGAATATQIREILGILCTEVSMEIWDVEWQPPLAGGG